MACVDCYTGTLHSGTPSGRVTKVHGLPTYIASPSGGAPKGLIIIISDAFGWSLPNTRILADTYAQKGNFLVYVPDFMNGYTLPNHIYGLSTPLLTPGLKASLWKPLFIILILICGTPWILRYLIFCRTEIVLPRIKAFFHALRANSPLPLGAAGFCWGGRYALLMAAEDGPEGRKGLVDAAFVAHPSKVKVPEEVESVRCPVSIAAAGADSIFSTDDVDKTRIALDKKADVEFEIETYEGATHGFAVRNNPAIAKEKKQGIDAEVQAIA
ncbi:MAG: hypothetical protein M1825_004100 [Sarcosagium campestre]|nr:MAG: hypothetical protein M1825_004100 [Sarcosagium campestre]